MNVKENKMGTMPINKLLISMALPMMISMLVQAMYNIVDSMYVSRISEDALTAVSLAFPIQQLMIALGAGMGVGVNAVLSKALGEKDFEKANKAAENGIFLSVISFVVFFFVGLFAVDPFYMSQTTDPEILQAGHDYLTVICCASIGMYMQFIFERLMQSTGRTVYSMITQTLGAVINIVLDPILIFGMFGMPEMGVKGAAYATIIGQIVSFVCALIFHLKVNKEISNGLRYMKPDLSIIKGIYAIGFPAIIAQALTSVMTYALNVIFVKVGENVVTAYGLYYKIQQFILFAAFGLRDAITPIVSFNHGMNSKKRVKDGIKYGMTYTLVIMVAGLVILELFAKPFSTIFGLSGATATLCVSAIRIVSLSYLFAGANIAYQGIFQALDSGLESLIISICRQFLFVIPVAWGLAKLVISNAFPTWSLWVTFLIAEGLSTLIAFVFMKKVERKKINSLA